MSFSALIADELGTLAAEGDCFTSCAQLTEGLYFALGFLHVGVELLHTVDKEGSWKLIWIILRNEGVPSTFGAGKRLVGASSPR